MLYSHILTDAVQQNLNKWLLKTQNFLNEVTSPLGKTSKNKDHIPAGAYGTTEIEDIVMAEHTVNISTPNGLLSSTAVVSIEQFSRSIITKFDHLTLRYCYLNQLFFILICSLIREHLYITL